MAAEEITKAGGNLLTKAFNAAKGVVNHMVSPTMIFMMVAMAFPMVSAAATTVGSAATFGDIGLATADMYVEMIKAPFTDGGVVFDAFGNAAEGNIAPGSYEWGSMDHSNMAGHESMVADSAGASGHSMAGAAEGLTHQFNTPMELYESWSPEVQAQHSAAASAAGMSLDAYMQDWCPPQ